MKITILGSSGGESFPANFCGCGHCEAARLAGGKSMRTLSQTLINDDLLVDLPADTAAHARAYGLNLGDVANILITHVHHDHFQPTALHDRGHVYAHKIKYPELGLWGSQEMKRVYDAVCAIYPMNASVKESIKVNTLESFETRRIGNYTVTALPAKHGTKAPLNYIIADGGATLLYLHDTGYPSEPIFAYLKENNIVADAVFMDATMGVMEIDDSRGHMSFDQDKRLKNELILRGAATEKTVFAVNHITHNKAETHEKIEEIFEGTGILVSYDGMVVEI